MCNTDNLLDVEDMVAELKSSGLYTKEDVVNGILDQEEDSFPLLARLATSQEYWYDGSVDVWSPICAIHLLAKMKHYRAQLAINSAIMVYYDDAGDWLCGDLPYVLAHMGRGAISTLTALMQYGDADMFVRGMAAHALVMIMRKHPETKPGIIASVMDAARREPDIEERTILVDALLDLVDPDLYEYLSDSLKTGFVQPISYDMAALDMVYETQRSSRGEPRDPLSIFGPKYKRAYSLPDHE